jgi:hypothetical protein
MLGPINTVEPHGLRHSAQAAIESIGPGMIWTGKSSSVPAGFAFNTGAPMPADVQKCLDIALFRPGDEQWHARVVVGQEIADIGKLGTVSDDDREVAEQNVHLLLELFWVGVLRDWIVHDLTQHLGGVLLILIQDAPNDLALFCTNSHGWNNSGTAGLSAERLSCQRGQQA